MKVTAISAVALPLFASLSSAFLVVPNVHKEEASIWNYNEQTIRLVCDGCPWDGEGKLSDLIFTARAFKNKLSLNDVIVNTRRIEGETSSIIVKQVPHGANPDEKSIEVPVEFVGELRGVATARDRPESVDNAHIKIKTVNGKTVDLQPLEIIHHVDGIHANTVSILRAEPGHFVECNTATCKAKQTFNHGLKAFRLRITIIKGKIMEHAKAFKAGCGGNGRGHGRPRPEMMHHGRPHPEMMHHGRPHHVGHHRGRPHRFHSRTRGFFESLVIVVWPIFFGIAAGILTSLLAILAYKIVVAIVSLFRSVDTSDTRARTVEENLEALGLLDEKVDHDSPPEYEEEPLIVVVPAEKE